MKYIFAVINKFFAVIDWLRIKYQNYRFYYQNPQRRLFKKQFGKFWKAYSSSIYWDGKSVVICEYQQNIFLGLGVAILANIIAKVKRCRVIYFNPIPHGQKAWFLSVFPNQIFSNYHSKIIDKNDLIDNETELIFRKLNHPQDILSIHYEGVQIGSFIYDEILRSPKGWKASVWEINEEVKYYIKEALLIIHGIKYIKKSFVIKSAVFTHTVGIKMGGLALFYLMQKDFEVYCGRVGLRAIKKYNKSINHKWIRPLLDPSISLIKELIDAENKDTVLARVEDYLNQRFHGKHKDSDSLRAFSKKNVLYDNPEDFALDFNLDKNRPIVFVMLHAFNDYPHHFENNLFLDYYRWFIHTLKVAQRNTNVNWIFKEHPSSLHYPDDANLEGIFEIETGSHIKFLDRDVKFNTFSLRDIASCVITCVGTAGLEFSCFGVPVILGGENYYTKYGIGILPGSVKEYDDLLMNLGAADLEKPDQEKRDLAKILFYVVFRFLAVDTPINNRFIPFHNIDIAKSNNQDDVLEYALSEINDESVRDYISKIEEFIFDNSREDFVELDDIIKDTRLTESNFARSVISS